MKVIFTGFEKALRARSKPNLREGLRRIIREVFVASPVVRVRTWISVDKAEKKPKVGYFVYRDLVWGNSNCL